ncbi:MAG: M48 family metallopeptidase [Magnetococcales bacterium]|nr:M48 family metallopeptidase [Magnetococcales bacterium]
MIGQAWSIPVLLFLLLVQTGCANVALTGRRQVALLPESQVLGMSFQAYDKMLKESEQETGTRDAAMVQRVGQRIQQAVERYFGEQGQREVLKNFRWEYRLVKNPAKNAACYPGGKVVVNTGLLPVSRTEAGLAAVLGHEIAHAVANHGNERMSQEMLARMGGSLLSQAIGGMNPRQVELVRAAYGLGTQYAALLPYSRLHESEADRLGTIFMAMAGYDPREAVGLWERMARGEKGGGGMEFLSTHPLPATRIRDLQNSMPEAMAYYQRYHPGGRGGEWRQ